MSGEQGVASLRATVRADWVSFLLRIAAIGQTEGRHYVVRILGERREAQCQVTPGAQNTANEASLSSIRRKFGQSGVPCECDIGLDKLSLKHCGHS